MKQNTLPDNSIAIVGIACRFPGARNLDEFWDNLLKGRESITFFGDQELDASLDPGMTGKPNYVRAKGTIDDADKFDARFFGMSPAEADLMDPQQRLLLQLSWAALEDAGIVPGRADNLIGVWVGTNWNRYYARHVRGSAAERRFGEFNTQLANEFDFPASRIAYKLNLTGPAITLATACSTSLVALGQAMQSLLNFECDAALAGGASVSVPLNAGYQHQEGGMLSADGHCRPFDAAASGTTFNDGAAVVTLKRLEDAIRDNDDIYALVRGVGINNDGSDKVSYTAPSVSGQIAALKSALAVADVDPATVGFIETHGTATHMGDPIEVSAIRAVYGAENGAPPCALGSLKSNIGHVIHAAGIAGVIKAALCVRHGVIPPTLHFATPNPGLRLDDGRFFVNRDTIAWESDGPRRAGVSSFGVGGTNAHAIVEQAPARAETRITPDAIAPPLLLVSAKDTETCVRQIGDLAQYAAAMPATITDIGYTLAHRRARFESRAAIFAADTDQLGSTGPESSNIVRGRSRTLARIVWAFPGQGAQRGAMGAGLIAQSAAYRQALAAVIGLANPHLDLDLATLLERGAIEDERISETRYAQPALFAVGYALARHYESLGLEPDLMIGHSIGEFVAACIAGVFSLEDAVKIVCERGRLMQAQPRGSMLSVSAPPASLGRFVDEDVCIAVQNAPEACVLAGPTSKIEAVAEVLRGEELRVTLLHTSHAFHSGMMDGALAQFRTAIEAAGRNAPRIPIVSTCTGQLLTDEEATSVDYWVGQLRKPVKFSDAIATSLALDPAGGIALLELGPGRTLSALFTQQCRREDFAAPALGLDENDAWTSSWLALGALWCAGYELPAETWWESGNCVRLPTYPFRRDVHWLAPVTRESIAVDAGSTDKAQGPEPDLQSQVIALFIEVTGLDLIAQDGNKTFPEVGLDSLLLTQIAVALQESFDVAINIKDLVNATNTINKVIQFIDARAPRRDGATVRAESGAIQGAGGLPIQTPLPRRSPKRRKRGVHRRDTRPQSVTDWNDLGLKRSAALRQFIAEETAKTAGSKLHTAKHRRAHADPRTASGYHRVWKEIVYPLVCTRSLGAEIWDIDGNRYVDMLSGFGPNMLGHGVAPVNEAIRAQLASGIEIGPQSALAGETATLICELTGMDRVSFMCTGSEAVQAAIRCARTFTRRTRIVLFEGAYHGNFDEVLVRSANQPGMLRTIPGSPGIPRGSVSDIVVLPWNSPASLSVIDEIGDQIAAVIVEPVQSRTPDIQPAGFLRELRAITRRHDALLIFDEVVTGFRCHPGGAQAYFDIQADIATYGKVAGGNMPIGIVAGREAVMNTFDGGPWEYGDDSMPSASVTFFAGTFVRHPLAIAACHAMLTNLKKAGPELQTALADRATRFVRSVNDLFRAFEAPFEIANFTSVMYLRNNDMSALGSLFWYALRHNGVFALEGFPSYLTAAHTDEVLDEVVGAVRSSLEWMVDAELLLAPRRVKLDTGPAGTVPVESPVKGARLGEDPRGMPGWYSQDDSARVDVISGRPAPGDPFQTGLEAIIPASESQQEVWSAAQLGTDASCAFNESVSVTLTGPLNVGALRAAIGDVALRHRSMRATFSPDGSILKLRADSPIALSVVDDRPVDDLVAADVATPFDLVRGPLFRFSLVRQADDVSVLVMTAHHIVCDGWSSYLILKELGNRYRARCGADVPALPDPGDPAIYNRDAADLSDTESEDYWLDEFDTIPPVVDFPTDATRPGMRTFESRRIDLRIPVDRLNGYKALGAASGASLFNVLLAGWLAYVARLTGTTDLVVGIPSAGQVSSGMPNLVGHCVNLLPLRVNVDLQEAFTVLVRSVQERMGEALGYQDYTFGRLLKRLPLPRDPGRLPLIPVQFNLDPPADPGAFDYGDVDVAIRTNPRAYENFELFINIAEDGSGLEVQLQYNRNLFSDSAMNRRMSEYFLLLDSACASSVPISQLAYLTPADLALLGDRTSGAPTLDHGRHFLELFATHVARTPDAIAVVASDRSLTYRELDTLSTHRAMLLIGALADANGALVGIALARNSELLATLLAVWKSGAAYVPLDPEFPADRLAYMINDAGLAAVLTTSDVTVPAAVPLLHVDRLGDARAEEIHLPSPDVDRTAYVIYTSGSTGQPKGVAVGHRAVSNFVQSMAAVPGLAPSDRLVAVTTLSFDIAVLELYGPLSTGGTVIIASHEQTQDGQALKRLLEESDANVMQATPVTWRMLLDAGWQTPSAFRVLCGGEAFPGALASALVARAAAVFNLYGPTEATVWSTVFAVNADPWNASPEAVVPIGRPIHGTSVHILDAHLAPLPVGVPGELYIGGVGLATGYLNREELTSQRFIHHPLYGRIYRTGDRATMDDSGVLRFRERIDSQVKVRGFRIELGEIESVLTAHPDIVEAIACVYEPAEGDTRLVAYYVARTGPLDESDLRQRLADRLPRYMVPQHFVPMDAIPLTPNRKADRKALPPPLAVRTTIVGPRNTAEELVASLWKEVLRVERISVLDDFFSLGGHSVLATRMISMLEDRSGVRLPLRTLFGNTVLEDFAAQLTAAQLLLAPAGGGGDREVLEF